jgi:spore germination cell wall hydrolase CwlJ-like protein
MKKTLIVAGVASVVGYTALYNQQVTNTVEVVALSLEQKESQLAFKDEPIVIDLGSAGQRVNMETEIGCLTANIFFEAANQSETGMTAVAYATTNRANQFGNKTVCQAVKKTNYNPDGTIITNKCHFSWVCDGNLVKFVPDDQKSQEAWSKAYRIAKNVLENQAKNPIGNRNHYCTLAVEHKTSWVPSMKKSSRVVIGDHVFYEEDKKKVNEKWTKYINSKKDTSV